MFVDFFIIPMRDDGTCKCYSEEIFTEEKEQAKSDPCGEGACDCMAKASNYEKPKEEEFSTLFAKYNEANKLVINLNKQNELLAARNEQLTKTNDYLIEQNKNIKKKYMEVFEALKAFEKRVSSLLF